MLEGSFLAEQCTIIPPNIHTVMSTTAFDDVSILDAVHEMYAEVATHPSNRFHFPTGSAACRYVGYPDGMIEALPEQALESFAGVGNPFLAEVIDPGDTVVDVGFGSGVDVLVAALETRPSGRVYGVDVTEAMLEKAEATVRAEGGARPYSKRPRR